MDTQTRVTIDDLRACPEWLPLLARWHQQAWGISPVPEVAGSVTDTNSSDADLNRRQQRLRTHLGEGCIPSTLVARQPQGQAVGCISMVTYRRLAGDRHSYWLANLYVLPEWRQQGVGAKLLQAALACLAAEGLQPVNLYTTDKEPYYARRGWRTIRRGRFRRQAAVVMRYEPEAGVASEPTSVLF